MGGVAVGSGEDVGVSHPQGRTLVFGLTPASPVRQLGDGTVVQVNRAASGTGLVQLVADRGEGSVDREPSGFEVDLAQRRPSSSPRRMPVFAASHNGAWKRLSAMLSRNARSCWAFHAREAALASGWRLGAWAMVAGLVQSMPGVDPVRQTA